MVDDAATRQLERELRHFRRQSEPFASNRLVDESLLVEFLGYGNRDQAWNRLLQLATTASELPDSDVATYFKTCGWETEGDNLDQRLETLAAAEFKNARTILRASDRGVKKFAQILRLGEHGTQRPFVHLLLQERDGLIRTRADYYLAPGSEFRLPNLTLNGDPLEVGDPVWTPSREYDTYDRWRILLPEHPVRPIEDDSEDPAYLLRASWMIPVWPCWHITTHLLNPRLYANSIVHAESITYTEVSWNTDPESWTFVE